MIILKSEIEGTSRRQTAGFYLPIFKQEWHPKKTVTVSLGKGGVTIGRRGESPEDIIVAAKSFWKANPGGEVIAVISDSDSDKTVQIKVGGSFYLGDTLALVKKHFKSPESILENHPLPEQSGGERPVIIKYPVGTYEYVEEDGFSVASVPVDILGDEARIGSPKSGPHPMEYVARSAVAFKRANPNFQVSAELRTAHHKDMHHFRVEQNSNPQNRTVVNVVRGEDMWDVLAKGQRQVANCQLASPLGKTP